MSRIHIYMHSSHRQWSYQANDLGLVGFCKNTPKGTVEGTIQGSKDASEAMKRWLATTGSPKSVIERVDVSDEKEIDEYQFEAFTIDESYGHAPRPKDHGQDQKTVTNKVATKTNKATTKTNKATTKTKATER
jgi:acylphosphatase